MTDCQFALDTGEAIVSAAATAIDTFRTTPINTLVALGQPVSEFRCDGLSIWLQTLGPDAPSLQQLGRFSTLRDFAGFHPTLVGQWEVQLWSNCYPGIQVVGDVPYPPDLADLAAANTDLYRDGVALYMGILDGVANGFPGMPDLVEKIIAGPMRPLGPQGDAAGWACPISVWYGNA